jgi:regulator of sirC expression with transglutaminase-like and TPR domain
VTGLRERFRDAVRSDPEDLATPCLLISAEADQRLTDLEIDALLAEGHGALDRLAEHVALQGAADERLRQALGGLHADPSAYALLESSLLPHVLASHRGLPILLSVVWLETARRAGIGACGLALPGRFVVAVGTEHEQPQSADLVAGTCVVVDPFAGGRPLSLDDVRAIAREHGGAEAADDVETLLTPAAPVDVLHRILRNIVRWADRPERTSTALWACEYALLLPRRPATLLREHAELLGRSGRFIEASDTYARFADEVELVDAEAAERARILGRLNRARLN